MDLKRLNQISDFEWQIAPRGNMKVPGVIYATAELIQAMDDKVSEQVSNVACLPGIVKASFAMPDAHWGYGFPIGGVAAFTTDKGVISAGGVGFDISCGVRDLHTGLRLADLRPAQNKLADELYVSIPAGVGSVGRISLDADEMERMLSGGACWAVARGYGIEEDLDLIEHQGRLAGAVSNAVSDHAKRRQRDEMGTLGSGNHYLEVQRVVQVYDDVAASALGLAVDDVLVSIHCGSRGLGHQVGTDYLREMVESASEQGLDIPDRELACARIDSDLGRRYLGAMRAAANCALANRQIITHLARQAFARIFPDAHLNLLYDVSHNTCKVERHEVDGSSRELFVHRKGATRAFGPGHPDLPPKLRAIGQPVLIGGSMGTSSFILLGTAEGMTKAFGSACHGAGRSQSRHQALKTHSGRQIVDDLARRGILIRCPSTRGVAEEAPDAYKDVDLVALAAEKAGLAKRIAKVEPLITIKG